MSLTHAICCHWQSPSDCCQLQKWTQTHKKQPMIIHQQNEKCRAQRRRRLRWSDQRRRLKGPFFRGRNKKKGTKEEEDRGQERMENRWDGERPERETSAELQKSTACSSSLLQWFSQRLKLTWGQCLPLCLGCSRPTSISVERTQSSRCTGLREGLQSRPCCMS